MRLGILSSHNEPIWHLLSMLMLILVYRSYARVQERGSAAMCWVHTKRRAYHKEGTAGRDLTSNAPLEA